jgi:tRNA-dihydrouridine synthase 2
MNIVSQDKTGTTSVMVARAAQWNMSVLRNEGLLPLDTVVIDYLKVIV